MSRVSLKQKKQSIYIMTFHNMNCNLYLLFIVILYSNLRTIKPLITSNATIITGDIKYVCSLFRSKDYSIDDIMMPDVLTFCSCSVVHKHWALTARQCYVQLDWFVSVIVSSFTNKLPDRLHTIQEIYDNDELSLVLVTPEFEYNPITVAPRALEQATTCKLFGFSTPDGKPVKGNSNTMIYKVWHMEGNLLQTNVEAMYYKDCKSKFNDRLSEYKSMITLSTLCLNSVGNEYLEPCAFDRGAPIICNGLLQGVLVYERPLPRGIPLHLPVSCYGNINQSLSIYAESITLLYAKWIEDILKYH